MGNPGVGNSGVGNPEVGNSKVSNPGVGNSEEISRQDWVDQQNLINGTPGCQVNLTQTF